MSQDPTQHGPHEQRPGRPDEQGDRGRQGSAQAPDFAPPTAARPTYTPGFGQSYGQPGPGQQPYGQPGPAPQPYGQYSPAPPPYGQPVQGHPPYAPLSYGQPGPGQQAYEQEPYGQQAPYGPPQPGAEDPARDDNPLNALFDLSFTQYATPAVIRVLYILLILVGGISWLLAVVSGFAWSGASGLGALVGGGIALATWILLVRVSLEFFLSIIRVAQDAQTIREGLEELRGERTGTAPGDKGETSDTTADPA